MQVCIHVITLKFQVPSFNDRIPGVFSHLKFHRGLFSAVICITSKI